MAETASMKPLVICSVFSVLRVGRANEGSEDGCHPSTPRQQEHEASRDEIDAVGLTKAGLQLLCSFAQL